MRPRIWLLIPIVLGLLIGGGVGRANGPLHAVAMASLALLGVAFAAIVIGKILTAIIG